MKKVFMTIRTRSNNMANILALFSVVLLGFFVAVSPANAFTGKSKIAPLSSEVHTSKADFESKSDLIRVVPLDDKTLSYRIRLPKGWVKLNNDVVDSNAGTGILRQVSGYTSPPRIERRSLFRVSIIDLDSLITVDDWFISYMLEMGFSIEGMKIKSPRLVDAQYTVFEDGEPYVVRAVVTISGSRIVLAEYLVHDEVYQAEKDQQIWAMAGFALEDPLKTVPIAMKTFNFVDIAKFDYPANWAIQSPEVTDITRMEASVLNGGSVKQGEVVSNNNELLGRIDVSLVSKDQGLTLGDEINLLKEGLKKRNYKLGKYLENVEEKGINPLISSSRIDVYEVEGVSKKLAGYEYWVGVLESKSRYYLVRLTTVSRAENFKVWAQNVETYKVLLRSLGPASVSSDN
jgi:hypothetical protein